MADLEGRDLRSASLPFKRFRNLAAKYNHGTRLLAGELSSCSMEDVEPIDTPRERYKNSQPAVMPYVPKSRHNVTPKFVQLRHDADSLAGRVSRKIDAVLESRDEASLSVSGMAELATSASILEDSVDSAILYSFEKQRPSPNAEGREVALDELVDRAEEKWESGKTDRMVKEYEVLSREGEKVRLSAGKGKARGSQSQGESDVADEDEGFEVIDFKE